MGYSPWNHKESDMTEQARMHSHSYTEGFTYSLQMYQILKSVGSFHSLAVSHFLLHFP